MKLTKPQLDALKKYADGKAHNETALKIRDNVYRNLVKKGLVKRSVFLNSVITDKGRAALEDAEMTVYAGTYDGRNRMIVAAPTKKAAHAAMQAVMPSIGTLKTWDQWTAETGNDEECRVARAKPLAVFTKADNFRDERFVEKVKP